MSKPLYHFSENPDIDIFHPRAPLAHPKTEPFVFTIDEWHSPFYYFPRECPRIGIWPLKLTTIDDLELFGSLSNNKHMLLVIDESWVEQWEKATIYCYEFDSENGFIDCHDHGCWVSKESQTPLSVTKLTDLPKLCLERNIEIKIVPNLVEYAYSWMKMPEMELMETSLHISMTRMRNLPGWVKKGTPVSPPQ